MTALRSHAAGDVRLEEVPRSAVWPGRDRAAGPELLDARHRNQGLLIGHPNVKPPRIIGDTEEP